MPKNVWLDLEKHKFNLNEGLETAFRSKARKIVFVGLNLELLQKAFWAGLLTGGG
jgi:hypothetical protein